MAIRKNTRHTATINPSLAMTARVRGTGSVRIVSGKWRRTVITVPTAEGLRPTSERVRETVFDWLTHLFGSLEGRVVLDLFAGSGAMGFEAASRGADIVHWVDVNKQSIGGIQAGLRRLEADMNKKAFVSDAFIFLKQVQRPYNLIFIDPPFSLDLQEKALASAKEVICEEGLLYVESPQALLSEETLIKMDLVRVRAGSAGAVRFELLALAGSAMASLAKLSKEEKRRKK